MSDFSLLTTGMSGMIGMTLRSMWDGHFDISDIRDQGVDITDQDAVQSWIGASTSPVILHMAAKTDVDGCEEDKLLGEEGEAWQINVVGTEHIVSAAEKHGKRLIYLSTDFVFDGTKEIYTEEDETNPVNWYARTKEEGEIRVKDSRAAWTIVRIAYPYGATTDRKKDFVQRIVERMKKKLPLSAVTDHMMTPTYIPDIADGLAVLIKKPYDGIYHLVGSSSVSVMDAVDAIAKEWNLSAKITPTTREDFFQGRAFRPRNLLLKNDRITELGVHPRSFEAGIHDMHIQNTV